MKTYTYYFRKHPALRKGLPRGVLEVETHRQPKWLHSAKCNVFGHLICKHSLSQEQMMKYNLIPDPKNYVSSVMKG